MPFIEGVFDIILLCIIIAAAGFLLFWGTITFVAIIFITLAIGWIPIMMCASDPNMIIGVGFFGGAAYYALWVYALSSLTVIGVMVVRPDPDGLPPAFKFLAMFYPAPKAIRAASDGSMVDLKELADELDEHGLPHGSVYWNKTKERAYRRTAEQVQSEADYQDAQAEVHRAAQKLNEARIRAEEAAKRRKK